MSSGILVPEGCDSLVMLHASSETELAMLAAATAPYSLPPRLGLRLRAAAGGPIHDVNLRASIIWWLMNPFGSRRDQCLFGDALLVGEGSEETQAFLSLLLYRGRVAIETCEPQWPRAWRRASSETFPDWFGAAATILVRERQGRISPGTYVRVREA